MKYNITQTRLLYVYTIDDRQYKGLLKVGEVFVDNEIAQQTDMAALMKAVRNVLGGYVDNEGIAHAGRSYLSGVKYHLEYVVSTTYDQIKCYKAEDIHNCLKYSGVEVRYLHKPNNEKERADVWFACSLDYVKRAISAVKEGHKTFNGTDELVPPSKIIFRPEQVAAIKQTVETLSKKTKNDFLWNAKMRFGKTTCGLQVAKELGVKTTLIVTHRPVVDAGWHDDFNKIFGDVKDKYTYRTRSVDDENKTFDFKNLTLQAERDEKRLIFFVSIQYLRLSELVGGKNVEKLKRDIMQYPWELVMIDEAHEGTESTMGKRVIEKLRKPETKVLSLSGTPFNLLDKYDEDQIYTWDYVMEQQAKREWDDKHFGDPNPYAVLPRMQILTFTLSQMLHEKLGEGNVFKFHEFFRVWTGNKKDDGRDMPSPDLKGHFIYEQQVKEFLDRLCETSTTSQYPFSRKEFRQQFSHTFWLLPYVKEAAAMEALLKEHKIFKNFKIVNVAGDGNMEDTNGSALKEVQEAIKNNQRTITLSCGKLTTGVSVPQWTAVLCMKGSENTPAANYMQTIFRVQTHAVLNGRQKSDAYVFDFAPDRALTAVAETSKIQASVAGGKGKLTKTSQKEEESQLASFLELCPVISMDGAQMGRHFSANQLFEKLKNVYVERAVRSGYADNSLYNPEALMDLTPEQEQELNKVHDLLGSMPSSWKPDNITVNKQGFAGTEGAEEVQYVFYLSDIQKNPGKPSASHDLRFENGAPVPCDEDWTTDMPSVSEAFPYLYSAHCEKRDGKWGVYCESVLWKEWHEDKGNEAKGQEKTEEQKRKEQEAKEKRARMSVLRGVSIRIPLLVYGAEIDDDNGEEITIDNFSQLVDDASWAEYMPTGFTKKTFNKLKSCFDRSIFTGAAKRIRQMVKAADDLDTEDRINQIALIFSYFHNPDKETVLTPWRVVNMQLSKTLGGWCFFNKEFDDNYKETDEFQVEKNSVRFENQGQATEDVFGDYNTRILEINSKTGLYPLYMAYSVFREAKEKAYRGIGLTGVRGNGNGEEGHYNRQAKNDLEIWKDVLQDNIFVICRTPMAVSITKRTLAGFRKDIRMNVKCYEHNVSVTDLLNTGVLKKDLFGISKIGSTRKFDENEIVKCDMIDVLRSKPEYLLKDIVKAKDFWHVYSSFPLGKNEDINNMKFSAIVGNPPYQLENAENKRKAPIYNLFMDAAFELAPRVTFITPARFLFRAGQTSNEWIDKMLSDNHFKVALYEQDSTKVFPNVDIKGGIAVSYRDTYEDFGAIGSFSAHPELNTIAQKVKRHGFEKLSAHIYAQSSYKLSNKLHEDYPNAQNILSEKYTIGSDIFDRLPDLFTEERPNDGKDYIQIYGRKGSSRVYRWVRRNYICDHENLDKYKIIIPAANGSGAIGEVLSTPVIGQPVIGHTKTFISLGAFDTETEAEAALKYIKGKFSRTMLGILKITQNNNRETWSMVPYEDFSSNNPDIDWSKSVREIDQQLYKKYGLSAEEIDFIERMIKPME